MKQLCKNSLDTQGDVKTDKTLFTITNQSSTFLLELPLQGIEGLWGLGQI